MIGRISPAMEMHIATNVPSVEKRKAKNTDGC